MVDIPVSFTLMRNTKSVSFTHDEQLSCLSTVGNCEGVLNSGPEARGGSLH
jgi:hypothetical protein